MTGSPKRFVSCIVAVLLVVLPFCAGCGDDNGGTEPEIRHPQDFFPQSVGGLTRDGSPRTATTETELQDLINGGYETFTSHNFEEFAEQAYMGTVGDAEVNLTAWIFEFETVGDAANLYEDERVDIGGCEGVDEIGNQQELCRALFSLVMQIQRDEYWMRLTITSSSQDARQVLDLIATHIDDEITG